MIKVVNISSKTVEIAGVKIKPHKIHIFEEMSVNNRAKLAAMSAVGIVRAYEGDYANKSVDAVKDIYNNDNDTNNDVSTKKSNKKSNKKK